MIQYSEVNDKLLLVQVGYVDGLQKYFTKENSSLLLPGSEAWGKGTYVLWLRTQKQSHAMKALTWNSTWRNPPPNTWISARTVLGNRPWVQFVIDFSHKSHVRVHKKVETAVRLQLVYSWNSLCQLTLRLRVYILITSDHRSAELQPFGVQLGFGFDIYIFNFYVMSVTSKC